MRTDEVSLKSRTYRTSKGGRGMTTGRRIKRMQREAVAVSIARAGGKVNSFAERQQLAERAPLISKSLGGLRVSKSVWQ